MKNLNVKPMSSENRENSLVRSFLNFSPIPEMSVVQNRESSEKFFFSYFQNPSVNSKMIEKNSEKYYQNYSVIRVAEKGSKMKVDKKENQMLLEPVKSSKGFFNYSPVPEMLVKEQLNAKSFFNYQPVPEMKLESGEKDASKFYVNYSPFVKEQVVRNERKSSKKGFRDSGVCVS